MITIQTRQLGRRRPLLDDWSMDFPPEWRGGDEPLTLRAFITKTVLLEVDKFQARQNRRATYQVLTAAEMEEGLRKGSVRPGLQAPAQAVDAKAAVGAALQAFEDGIYLVILDGEEQHDLDREIYLGPGSVVVFLRLVMLAGA